MDEQDANADRDTLLAAVLRVAERAPAGWHGSASELLALLDAEVPPASRGMTWPRNPKTLGQMLSRLASALAAAGIELWRTEEGHDNRRVIHLAPGARPGSGKAGNAWQGATHEAAALPAAPPKAMHGGWQVAAILVLIAFVLAAALLLPLPPANPPAA